MTYALRSAITLALALLIFASLSVAEQPRSGTPSASADRYSGAPAIDCEPTALGSPFLPVDSWIYPAMWRLYALGYVDKVFLGIRPWTRSSIIPMLDEAASRIEDATANGKPTAGEAQAIYTAISHELFPTVKGSCVAGRTEMRLESAYSVSRMISGTPLRDSFHLGSTVINDYGRPYESGYNNFSGISGYATAGRFTLYVRGEFEGAPSAAGYSDALAQTLSTNVDSIPFINPSTNRPYPQTTIPLGPVAAATNGRLLEAYVSSQILDNVISFGKEDEWLSPAEGA